MTLTPFRNALTAAGYIVFIVYGISSLEFFADSPDTILIPMAMLSLLTLSVAVMGFLFFFEPVRLSLDKERRQEGFTFFAKTVAFFAGFVVLFFVAMITASYLGGPALTTLEN